ncbi:hypothetical protein RHS01_04616 [Rhizoctonia solani]|uniref:Uncharacterized protein n=1 Tax=Rhizoctonia solani TaxID=456999 RepID=A0A8H7IHU8_9AGAM|nr:hypothetical protein RHS01_04616 [Rhizoctonia solani]
MSQDNNGIEAPTQAERDTFANTYIVGLHSTGPRKSRSAPGLAIVGEHSGAFGMTLRSARGVLSEQSGSIGS